MHSASEPRVIQIEDAIDVGRTLTLRDGGRVTTVLPTLALQQGGGFFVVDLREHQIRRYDSIGNLISYFGRPGSGPAEFERLAGAVQTRSGAIIAADASGYLAYLDSTGRESKRVRTGLGPIYNIALVNDSVVALTGRLPGRADGPFVHLWNTRQERIANSFFDMPRHAPELAPAYAYAGAVDVAVRHDTVAAIVALSDTVYLFTTDGRAVGKLPMPSRHFRQITRPPPPNLQEDVGARVAWSSSFSRMSKVFWAADGSLYVQYFDLEQVDPRWSLIHMRRGGTPPVEMHDVPRLLTVSPFDNRLYFINPQTLEPNQWVIGTRSSGS
jgi:hypothetical protein